MFPLAKKGVSSNTRMEPNFSLLRGKLMIQSYPPRAFNRRLQEDWAKDAREGPRVLMSLRVDFGPMG